MFSKITNSILGNYSKKFNKQKNDNQPVEDNNIILEKSRCGFRVEDTNQ